MKPFHYVNVDPQAGAYVAARDCPNGCVVSALDDFSALLGSEPPLSLSERRFAIYWVAHLVGDIHQPLHVAHPDGKGGTATPVLFFGEAQRPNAHWVWDVGLIEHRPPELAFAASKDPPAWRALGESLAASITPAQLRSWRAATSAEAWATESLALSRREAFLTPGAVIDAAYEARHWPSVAQQLEKAGVRLAALLERTLGPKATPATR
jgi:hypothetical protein